MKIIRRLGVIAAITLVISYLGLCWMFSNLILFPESSLERTKSRIETRWGSSFDKMIAPLPVPEEFAVNTFDGLKISGKYFQKSDSARCVIIMAHGWTSTWAGMLKYVPALSDCNCDLVLYDHRVHGESEGIYATGGVKEAKDLLSITTWVEQEKGLREDQIGWFGASWGGATVLTAGAEGEKCCLYHSRRSLSGLVLSGI